MAIEVIDGLLREPAVVIELFSLDLSGMELTQEDVITLSSMKGLRKLNLAKTTIRDSDLQDLALLSNLEFLDLSATSVTDMGIQYVKKLHNLGNGL